jgi:micrococcal nuclease
LRTVALVVLLAIAAFRLWQDETPAPGPLAEGSYQVERVVDGDTLVLVGGHRVRLIGVNTPETVAPDRPVEPWGPEASAFTRSFVGDQSVRLQLDRERIDQHGRHLAYVWNGNRLLNEELIRAGLGRYEPQFYYSPTMKRRFQKAQDSARRDGVGIWSETKNSIP